MSIKTPAEISQAALAAGIAKSRLALGTMVLALGTMLLMGFLAGAYIGMGGYFMLVVTQDAAQVAGVGISKLLGGVVFSLGLFLVLTAGAELVTGNCLMPVAYLSKKISFAAMLTSAQSTARTSRARFSSRRSYIRAGSSPSSAARRRSRSRR